MGASGIVSKVAEKFEKVMPEGAGALFFIQIFSTLSFSVLYSTLVLYMTKQLGLDKTVANNVTGMFLAFNYGLHLLGGYFGGRLLSNRALFSWGMLAQVLGCFLISIPSVSMLYWGLAAFLTGSGLNVTCINCMLTQRFKPEDKSRESAFLWNYSGMNIGFFIGFSISGYFQLSSDYHQLFLLSSLGNLFALSLVLFNWKSLKDVSTPLTAFSQRKQWIYAGFGVLVVALMIPVMEVLVKSANFSNRLVMSVGVGMAVILSVLALQQPTQAARKKMFAFLLLAIASLVFWTLYQIAPMGLVLFIKHNVNSHMLGYLIPPQWVQNINTIIIVFGGPILSVVFSKMRANGRNINIPMQFSTALLLIGLGFVVLPLGIGLADSHGLVNFNWIVLSYVLQSLGELFISPIGYAMVGQLAPERLQGIMMGSWMMVSGVAATLSRSFSNMMVGDANTYDPLVTNASFSHTFNLLGWGAIGCGVLLVILIPTLMRLIKSNHDEDENGPMAVPTAA